MLVNYILDKSLSGASSFGSCLESEKMEQLNQQFSRLSSVRSNLLRRMRMYTPDDVVEETIDKVKDELDSILVFIDEYSNGVEAIE